MSDLIRSLATSASGMQAQSGRLRHVSENIANADTPGYRRKTVEFRDVMGGAQVALGPVRLDRSALERIYDPGHPLADETGHHDGTNVDLVLELADAREAQRSYEANLNVVETSMSMLTRTIDLLRI